MPDGLQGKPVHGRAGSTREGQCASLIDKVVKFTLPALVISEASGCRRLQIHRRSQWDVLGQLEGINAATECYRVLFLCGSLHPYNPVLLNDITLYLIIADKAA